MTATLDKLRAARLMAAERLPYFSSGLWAMDLIRSPGLGTLGVDDRWRCYYDPAFCDKHETKPLAAVLIHELSHLLRDHSGRAKAMSAEKDRYNFAADLEVNNAECFTKLLPLPREALTAKKLGLPARKLAEEYYKMVKLKKIQVGKLGPGQGKCGSCANGQKQSYELPGGNGQKKEEKAGQERSGLDKEEADLVRRQVAMDIQHAVERRRGTVPGEWAVWANGILTPPAVNWRREVAAMVRGSLSLDPGAMDYTYARPSRRRSPNGKTIYPALRKRIPQVAVIVDTSGSMSGAGDEVLSEVEGICRAVGAPVEVIVCDASVHDKRRVHSARDVRTVGGGGTDMRVAYDEIPKLRPKPEVTVCITDGETPWPDASPPGKHVVVIVGGSRAKGPDWAKVLRREA